MSGPIQRTPEMARKMLASLWDRNLPILQLRIEELEQAASALRQGKLTPAVRDSACNTAHKLAGSLGMFGYPAGTDAARRIEQRLEGHAPVDAFGLASDVHALKAALPI
jgi:HPt (histidine-containing phosphotransfer) domain-containing protein